MQFTSLDRIVSKLYRDLGLEEISETDVIEWVAEALEFISTPKMYENKIGILEVKNHQTNLPIGLTSIVQVVRDNKHKVESCTETLCHDTNKNPQQEQIQVEVFDCPECLKELDSEILTLGKLEETPKGVVFTSKYKKRNRFSPVRLSNHTFFNTLVCEEDYDLYKSCVDEYTIVNNTIRTSFKEGLILISYYRVMIDEETGYPLIPEEVSTINALTYYVMWKYNQRMWFMGREGYGDKMRYSQEMWDKYAGQAKSNQIILQGVDEYQNFTEEKFNWLKSFKYYNMFGNLGRYGR